MLWKLLKYDFRSMWKQFALVWPAALVLGLINRFAIPWTQEGDGNGGIMAVTAVMLLVAVLMIMGVLSLMFIVGRFYKGLLGAEGYLMNTLPVRPWQLIASKLICAVVVILISSVAAFLALVLMMPINWAELFTSGWLGAMLNWLRGNGDQVLYTAEALLILLVSLMVMVLTLYAAMAVGHLFQKHRAAMSLVAFLVIDIIISNLILTPAGSAMMNSGLPAQAMIWLTVAGEVLLCAVLFAAAERVLSRRLNLE